MTTVEKTRQFEELLESVGPQWHDEFLRFVQTGEAGDGFLAYMDANEGCQRAIEKAFNIQVTAFEELAKALAEDRAKAASAEVVGAGASVSRMFNKLKSVVAGGSRQR